MCGIFCIYSPERDVSSTVLDTATQTLHHRGPDGTGSWTSPDKKIGIGHTRLRIIDLSTAADQPFQTARFVLSFNGEIYNHKALRAELEAFGATFSTHSDTEVLVKAWEKWGAACLPKFNGCFAFILYDKRDHSLFIARDPLGEKQLVYTHTPAGEWVFASEIKALLAVPGVAAKPNPERFLSGFLFNIYADEQETYFQNIFSFPKGSYWEISLSEGDNVKQPKKHTYFTLSPQSIHSRSESDLFEEFNFLLNDSVKLRIDTDAKLGSVLSGGLDSSYITALAAPLYREKHHQDLGCFTVSYDDFVNRDLKNARGLAEYLGNIHLHEVRVQPDITQHDIDGVTRQLETPVVDKILVSIYRNYGAVSVRVIKTVLNGQGSDELWLGYYKVDDLYQVSARNITQKGLFNHWLEGSYLAECAHGTPLMKTIEKVITENLERNFAPFQEESPLQRVVYYALNTHLAGIFQFEDRLSMAHGVEVRLPHLDPRLVQLALSTSAHVKVRDGREKYVVRSASKNILPASIRRRTKQGFPTTPYNYDIKTSSLFTKQDLLKSQLLHDIFSEPVLKNLLDVMPIRWLWVLYSFTRMESVYFER